MTDIPNLVANLQNKMLEMEQQKLEYFLLMNYNPSISQYIACYRESGNEFYFLLPEGVELSLPDAKITYPYMEINYARYN